MAAMSPQFQLHKLLQRKLNQEVLTYSMIPCLKRVEFEGNFKTSKIALNSKGLFSEQA
jgi:hypothetical protein